jgi:hypothetical protein
VIILYCMLLLPICSVVMGLLGFWIGRCARRLPIIDDKLPWTLHRSQVPTAGANTENPRSGASRWP